MSISILNTKTIEKLGNSYNYLSKTFCRTIYADDLENTLKGLYNLNIKSWNERYKDDIITDEEKETFYKPNFRSKEKFNNECEVLKALQCLQYNIELDKKDLSYQDGVYIEYLDNMINRLTSYIISNLEDYKMANWG